MAGNIVVPLDGSALAEKALPLAAALATRSGEKLVLLRLVAETAEIEAELKSARASVEEVHR
jgi:nucleotide-binding universal stress UspA family protein